METSTTNSQEGRTNSLGGILEERQLIKSTMCNNLFFSGVENNIFDVINLMSEFVNIIIWYLRVKYNAIVNFELIDFIEWSIS